MKGKGLKKNTQQTVTAVRKETETEGAAVAPGGGEGRKGRGRRKAETTVETASPAEQAGGVS